jgi:inner membrane protein
MMAPTHILVGIGTYALTTSVTAEPITGATLAAVTLGSLTPDIDHPSSKLGRKVFPFALVAWLVLGHRGITHSLLALAAISAALFYFQPFGATATLAFIVGYASHLLADWNTGGIPLFWPSKHRLCAPWCFSTGGIVELVFGIVLIATLLAWWSWSADLGELQHFVLRTGDCLYSFIHSVRGLS